MQSLKPNFRADNFSSENVLLYLDSGAVWFVFFLVYFLCLGVLCFFFSSPYSQDHFGRQLEVKFYMRKYDHNLFYVSKSIL